MTDSFPPGINQVAGSVGVNARRVAMSFEYEVKQFRSATDTSAHDRDGHAPSWARRISLEELRPETHDESGGGGKPYIMLLVDADRIRPEALRGLILEPSEQGDEGVPAASHGIFLFVSGSRSIEAWHDENPNHSNLKDNEFFIRLFRSYQLGEFVSLAPDEDAPPGAHDEDRVLRSRIGSIVRKHGGSASSKMNEPKKKMGELLKDVRRDAEKLWHIATEKEKLEDTRARLIRDAREEEIAKGEEEADEAREGGESAIDQPPTLDSFLDTLSLVYQIGRRPYRETEEKINRTKEAWWLRGYQGSFAPERQIDEALKEGTGFDPEDFEHPMQVLRIYRGYRDLARWLSSGAQHWAEVAGGVRALIIDQTVLGSGEDERDGGMYLRQLDNIRGAFRQEGPFDIDCATGSVVKNLKGCLDEGKKLSVRSLSANGPYGRMKKRCPGDLLDYHVILVEVEFAGDYLGPAIVKDLADHLDRQFDPHNDRNEGARHRPVIIVVSRTKHVDVIQQCLNLGAEWFMTKDRLYALPESMVKARLPRQFTEPPGRKSNFRLLYRLQPWEIVKLQKETITGHPEDTLDRRWLRSLPKADLHTHIGTCISLDAIAALAFNTSGYLLDRKQDPKSNPEGDTEGGLWEGIAETADRVCKVVLLCGVLNATDGEVRKLPAAKQLALAAEVVEQVEALRYGRPAADRPSKGRGVYGPLIEGLTRPDRQVAFFEVQSLLVAALCMAGGVHERAPEKRDGPSGHAEHPKGEATGRWGRRLHGGPAKRWEYLEELQRWDNEDRATKPIGELLDHVSKLCRGITGPAWHRGLTARAVAENFAGDEPWGRCLDMVNERIWTTEDQLEQRFDEALRQLRGDIEEDGRKEHVAESLPLEYRRYGNELLSILHELGGPSWQLRPERFEVPPLASFVRLPERKEDHEHSLARYLWGADLLGSEHLQYPENILLAAKDIVDQLVNENVAYTEIRCATSGYTAGGMSAIAATDLLCSSFDLAVMSTAQPQSRRPRPRWVRINVLLGAKRNKSEEQFQEIVSLLTGYLQRRDAYESDELVKSGIAPRWWKHSRVVGFDLSGDETIASERLEPHIEPLHKLSASITIHAGEAATAESIWRAVYRFGARRIGHGLRLRENKRLLGYFNTEGICVEMCPVSNQFTNAYYDAPEREGYDGSKREQYPLRFYLDEGLDVCVNTDNRQLHRDGTMVDEYLCAARLVGGLTKWEVLRLAKAGFKHAFLPKADIEVMLSSMEDEVYNLVVQKKELDLKELGRSCGIADG